MARFLNTLLLSTIVFIAVFCILVYYVRIVWLCALASAALSLACSLLLYKVTSNSKRQIKAQRKKGVESLSVYCALGDSDKILQNLFDSYGYALNSIAQGVFLTVEKEESAKEKCVVQIMNDDNPIRQTIKTHLPSTFVIVTHFNAKALDEEGVASNLKKYGKYGYVLFICRQRGLVNRICQFSQVQCAFWDINMLYSRLEDKGLLPEMAGKQYRRVNVLLAMALSAPRAKYYLQSSLFLAIFALVSFFPAYNLIFAFILLAVGIYAKFNKKYNSSVESEFQNSLEKL